MAGQDWIEKDFYAVLGVAREASADDVRKAYRKLARTLHPDANPDDPSAEARFKEVGEAYGVLSDPEQRRQYDGVRAMAGGRARFTGAGGPGSSGGGGGGFEDLLGGLFGGGAGAGAGRGSRPRYSAPGAGATPDLEDLLSGLFAGGGGAGPTTGAAPRGPSAANRGTDLAAETTLSFTDAVAGTTVTLGVEGRTVTARIPPGVKDGSRIRLRGKGRPGARGADAGDLLITVHVQAHPVFTRDGDDLRLTLPITFAEAALGADVDAPTLDGGTVRLRVAAGTPSGRTLRVRGRGVTTAKATGDLLVTTQVVVPQRLDDEGRRAVEAFAAATAQGDPRADLLASARAAAGSAMSSLPPDAPLFVISVAAQLAGMHPQTLRQYDRLGLVSPSRATGRGRRYSARDVVLLREVQRLSQEDGVNLAGIKRIMELEGELDRLRARAQQLTDELEAALGALQRSARIFAAAPSGDVVAVERGRRPRRPGLGSAAIGGSLVVWRPQS